MLIDTRPDAVARACLGHKPCAVAGDGELGQIAASRTPSQRRNTARAVVRDQVGGVAPVVVEPVPSVPRLDDRRASGRHGLEDHRHPCAPPERARMRCAIARPERNAASIRPAMHHSPHTPSAAGASHWQASPSARVTSA